MGTKKETEPIDVEVIRQGNIVSEEDSGDLIFVVTDEKIKETLFDIGNEKSPGPDGYSSAFFKKQ